MALIAAYLYAGVVVAVTVWRQAYFNFLLTPAAYPLPPILPVPNNPYGFRGR